MGHRDLLSMLHRSPLSTPASREVSSKLARSTIPQVSVCVCDTHQYDHHAQNKSVYRANSTAINTAPQAGGLYRANSTAINTAPQVGGLYRANSTAINTAPQVGGLYRANSTAINTAPQVGPHWTSALTQLQLQLQSPMPCTRYTCPLWHPLYNSTPYRLPRPLSSPHPPTPLTTHSTSRVQTPARRHMDFDPPLRYLSMSVLRETITASIADHSPLSVKW